MDAPPDLACEFVSFGAGTFPSSKKVSHRILHSWWLLHPNLVAGRGGLLEEVSCWGLGYREVAIVDPGVWGPESARLFLFFVKGRDDF